jgi:hypothetical protein
MAAQFHDRPGDGEGQQPDRGGADQQRGHRRPAVIAGQDRRRIGAEPEEPGMSEADLAGVADQQIEADADDRVQPDQDHHVEIEAVGQEQRQYADDRGQPQHAAITRRQQ